MVVKHWVPDAGQRDVVPSSMGKYGDEILAWLTREKKSRKVCGHRNGVPLLSYVTLLKMCYCCGMRL